MLFIMFIADLRPGGENNRIVRYADDASLLIPEKTYVQINYEFDKVVAWPSENKLEINMAKTKEIVFDRTHPKRILLPHYPKLKGSLCATLLGVWLQSVLGDGHTCR